MRRVALALGSLAALVATLAGALPAGAADATAGPGATPFYLALGASMSVGVQPSTLTGHPHATDQGYANDVAAALASAGTPVSLTQLGCPGETTASMISGADRCYHSGDSQLADAVAFLEAHAAERGIVTIDLGFNDVRSCFDRLTGPVDPACLAGRLANVRDQLAVILAALTAAAGPHVTFVGLNHYDPFVASPSRRLRASLAQARSVAAMGLLNETLADAYGAYSIGVAQVTRAFDQGDTTPTAYPGLGTVPAEVARVCELTWMCQPPPVGPNIHPNALGYEQIAGAVLAALPVGWASA